MIPSHAYVHVMLLRSPYRKHVLCMCVCVYVCVCVCGYAHVCICVCIHARVKLIAFELAGEDRDRKVKAHFEPFENCVFRVAQTWLNGIFPSPREFCSQLKRNQLYTA
jgi:hypothetical protein